MISARSRAYVAAANLMVSRAFALHRTEREGAREAERERERGRERERE